MGSLDNLRPWKPGQSGNPKGNPRGLESFESLVNKHLDAEEVGEEVVRDVEGNVVRRPHRQTRRSKVALRLVEQAEEGDMVAMKLLIDRVWPSVNHVNVDMPSWEELASLAKRTAMELPAGDEGEEEDG